MAPQPEDLNDVEFRLRNTRAGVALSVFCGLYLAAYCALTWGEPHRGGILAVAGAAILGSLAMLAVPLRPIMARPRARDAMFLAWSSLLIVLIALVTVLDGGVSSPLAVLFFLPPIFAALSYPLASMIAVAVVANAAYVGLAAAAGGVSADEVAVVALTLSAAGCMCAWQAREHDRRRDELARVSRADPLTGALNRRGFDERLVAELARAGRAAAAVGLILVDLDDFKGTNDRFGHAAGDDQLRWAVATMIATLRPGDAVGRLGGDEFAVLVPGAGPAETAALAGRLDAALAARAPGSIGVASYPHDGQDAGALQQVADLDLYTAKHARSKRRAVAGRRELSWATTLARAVDERMAIRHEHSVAVARYAALIGARLGFDDAAVGELRLAAVLHDVGKIAVPESVLRKPEPLTEAERHLVQRHPDAGADMIERIDGLEHLAPWVRHSHESFDGSGYPAGLAGEDIPLESRVLLVADAFDAMTSERTYSSAMTVDTALDELRRCAGRQFDPRCVELLCAALGQSGAGAVDHVVSLV